jgi:hypothetical protein
LEPAQDARVVPAENGHRRRLATQGSKRAAAGWWADGGLEGQEPVLLVAPLGPLLVEVPPLVAPDVGPPRAPVPAPGTAPPWAPGTAPPGPTWPEPVLVPPVFGPVLVPPGPPWLPVCPPFCPPFWPPGPKPVMPGGPPPGRPEVCPELVWPRPYPTPAPATTTAATIAAVGHAFDAIDLEGAGGGAAATGEDAS